MNVGYDLVHKNIGIALSKNTHLKNLSLKACAIDDAAISMICLGLKDNQTL